MIHLLRRDEESTHLGLMLALTLSTGVIDAVGYLGLDKVFTGNMTGNVVILGMALVSGTGLPILGPVLALVGFMAGAAIAGRVLRDTKAAWANRTTVMFGSVAATLFAAIIVILAWNDPPHWVLLSVTTALGLAMGLQAATARNIAVKDVTTVVVTSTITGLAADALLGDRGVQPWKRRVAAIVLIGSGAAIGAALLQIDITVGMALSAVITLAVAILGHLSRTPADKAADADGS
ncbi:YoaK family protein [Demequina aurantiaca]|uniref:YoaK family protein n=1 Tax=Demequina aurantiaca TaxID=676200 RepID=UPI003D34DA91